MQQSRFELKYVVSEAVAREVITFAKAYLMPDPYTPKGGGGYPVHSVYLDGPALPLCRSTLDGHRKRFKLRVRWYDDSPDAPAFCEIKQRNDKVISKQRVRVDKLTADRLSNALPIGRGWPTAPGDLLNMQRFCNRRDELGAIGTAVVSYQREAYISVDNAIRVTIDRDVSGYLPHHGRPTCIREGGQIADLDGPVVELKFTARFPAWMTEMVQSLQLDRRPVPKYVLCAQALGLDMSAAEAVVGKLPWTG